MKRRDLMFALAGAIISYICTSTDINRGFTGNKSHAAGPEPTEAAQEGERRVKVVVDDSNVVPNYANFARVTATPEEVIIDFGLNPTPFNEGVQNVKASSRFVMNFYTSKRLFNTLEKTIQRHEEMFGPIELDVQKRVKRE